MSPPNADGPLLALGAAHTCANLPDRGLLCWGKNDRGQVGDGTRTRRTKPVRIGAPVHTLAAGADHSCADDRCWGRNVEGELGDGTAIDRAVPTLATTLLGAAEHDFKRERWALTATASCLIEPREDGVSARCTRDKLYPYPNCGGGPCGFWASHETAYGETLCLLGSGYSGIPTLRCNDEKLAFSPAWSEEDGGERTLGVPSLADQVSVAVGRGFVCVARLDGRVTCGGDLTRLRGIGASSFTSDPWDAESIVAGESYACFVRRDRRVLCFGDEPAMGLAPKTGPRVVRRASDDVSLAAYVLAGGAHHACAHAALSGSITCWGRNDEGQLGDGTTTNAPLDHAVQTAE